MLTDSVNGPKKAVCHKCDNGLRFDALCRRARDAALDLSLLLAQLPRFWSGMPRFQLLAWACSDYGDYAGAQVLTGFMTSDGICSVR